ncbi:MAG TPA: zf-HC2 domain-containing protein [Thermoanaerobaculia bacterium]|jgi:anti-sigma factor RsiW
MNDRHLAEHELLDFLRGDLPQDRALRVVRHLDTCRACGAAAKSDPAVARSKSTLASLIADDDAEHPDLDTTLTAYVDATLPAHELAGVDAHLAACPRCRDDVADLRSMQAAMQPPARRSWLWPAIAAAAVLILIALLAAQLPRRNPPKPAVVEQPPAQTAPPTRAPQPGPSPAPPRDATTYARNEWTAAVQDAVRSGTIAMPASLAQLQFQPDALRGSEKGRTDWVAPAGTVLAETRPLFRWAPASGATYVVTVLDGQEVIAESGVLSAPSWHSSRDLPRGRTLQWQVDVRRASGRSILPAPPAPPALIRIVDRKTQRELAEARRLHPNDALLLGVLYARHGLREEALRELAKVDSPAGKRLFRSVRSWSK